jgi:16S rRNA processing protein RimM
VRPLGSNSASAETGSPSEGEPEYLAVGFLRRPHGVRGEMLMDVHTDFPERLRTGLTVYVGSGYQPMVIASRRMHASGMLVRMRGIKTPEEAGRFRNQWVYVPAGNRPPLPEGEYYHHQLIGLTVCTDQDKELGTLTGIIETGANDVYVVKDATGREVLLPAIPAVVLEVDLHSHRMRVHLLDGLI